MQKGRDELAALIKGDLIDLTYRGTGRRRQSVQCLKKNSLALKPGHSDTSSVAYKLHGL